MLSLGNRATAATTDGIVVHEEARVAQRLVDFTVFDRCLRSNRTPVTLPRIDAKAWPKGKRRLNPCA
jgi:hypothetical protein